MAKAEFSDASRAQVSFSGAAGKKCLVWLPARSRWINSDHLTALGLVALAARGWLLVCALPARFGSDCVLFLNWLGIAWTGRWRRVRNRLRPRYGSTWITS